MSAIHALCLSTYTVEVNGRIRVQVEAFDREQARRAALAMTGGGTVARVVSGPRDCFGECCNETEPHVH